MRLPVVFGVFIAALLGPGPAAYPGDLFHPTTQGKLHRERFWDESFEGLEAGLADWERASRVRALYPVDPRVPNHFALWGWSHVYENQSDYSHFYGDPGDYPRLRTSLYGNGTWGPRGTLAREPQRGIPVVLEIAEENAGPAAETGEAFDSEQAQEDYDAVYHEMFGSEAQEDYGGAFGEEGWGYEEEEEEE